MERRLAIPALMVLGVLLVPAFLMLQERFIQPLEQRVAPLSDLDNPVLWIWSGALTTHSVQIKARTRHAPESVRLLVASDAKFANVVWSGTRTSAEAAPGHLVTFSPDGLKADVLYHYVAEVDGQRDEGRRGSFRTLARGPFSFTIAFGSCARTGSSSRVFETIRKHQPLFFVHTGDLHYADIRDAKLALYQEAYDRVLRSATQSELFRQVPIVYVWDDHDYGPNNANATHPGRAVARQAFQQHVPHHPLAAGRGDVPIYRAFTVGRVRFLVTDCRSEKDPHQRQDDAQKSLLGAAQKAWWKQEMLESARRYPLIVWVCSVPWISPPKERGDHWGGYTFERRELANFLVQEGITGLIMLSGDAHMLGFDDGRHNQYADGGGPGFPVLHAAALDNRGSHKGGPYSAATFPGGGQFGLLHVEDTGGELLRVRFSGRDLRDRELLAATFEVPVKTEGR